VIFSLLAVPQSASGAVSVFGLLPPPLRNALRKRGINSPTPIQEASIPLVLKDLNVLIMAPTGSGKTEAALLPVAAKILERNAQGALRVMYVTPLRALNRDISIRAFDILKEAGLRVEVWHGDTPQSKRRKILSSPPEVLVTTPESLNIMLANPKMIDHLKNVKYVIVDELHELLEDKRGASLAVALERLAMLASFKRIGISATISEIEKAKKFLGGGRYVAEAVDRGAKRPEITVFVDDNYQEMVARTKDLVRRIKGTVLVFTNTRDTAEMLGKALKEELGDSVAVHHGSLSRGERERVERMAREGKLKAVVATASLELGIDIGSITHVIQFGSPRRTTNLVQRVGRAEHRPHERPRGSVVSGLRPYEAFEAAVIARRARDGNLEPLNIHKNPLDVLAHQVVGMLIRSEMRKHEIYNLVKRAYPFWELSWEDFESVMDLLCSQRLISCSEPHKATKKGEIYYRTTGMIVESKRYKVKVYGSGETVGTLDEEFVVELNPGDTFVLAGRVWKVIGFEEEEVIVEAHSGEGPPPSWEGELIPVDKLVAREVGALKRRPEMLNDYPLTDESRRKLVKYLNEISAPIATDKRIVIEVEGRVVVYNIHGGSKVNLALAYALSELAKLRYGSASFNTTPYHVVLFLPRHITPLEAKSLFEDLKEWNVEQLVISAAKGSKLYSWRLMKILVRMGLLDRKRISFDDLKRVEKSLKRVYAGLAPGKEALREIMTDKVDLEGLKDLLSKNLEVVARSGFSAQSKWALEKALFATDTISSPTNVVKDAVRMRLENRDVTMLCLVCGNTWRGKVKDVGTACRCGSRIVVPLFPKEDELASVAEKIALGKSIKRSEESLAREVRGRASLVASYGRDALLALAGRGIGYKTAARVLSEAKIGLKDLIEAIIEAEKTYLRTRRFW